ncbi:DEAD/DEAH box helicase family protein [Pseudomonas sp. J452]|uniref:DEAD/DEAH box helicase n=1 Tax=Pseudomonas sp. J452 TaxID=2898441 RepID=UPI0021ADB382|nr:DEAD/DEAH box helicase family protein [Pseudomonas sp. J452]UUY10477.1 DEAD/DEAH box helicase family protein [Pseudomonas sp. J452]
MVQKIIDYLRDRGDGVRGCQRSALESFVDYRQSGDIEKAFLVNLPTGAGKTGVIALIAHLCDEQRVLVVCHRKAVKTQLYREISKRFFRQTLKDNDLELKAAYKDNDFDQGNGVYITTFQKLSTLSDEDLAGVQAGFDLIVVDEGHSEPSPVWREIVRQSRAVKVVVTATPYRNDLFELNVSTDKYFVYTFREACLDGVIVEPEFHQEQVGNLLAVVRGFLNDNPSLKCIVKCKSLDDILVFHGLLSQEFVTVSVHDRVVNPGVDFKFKSVSHALKVEGARVIIHQHKLDEGVDIPEAKLLILTYSLGSGRELVQSVGRVVRNFEGSTPIVVDMALGANEGMWDGYLAFDTYISSDNGARDFLRSLSTSYLIEGFLNGFPQYSYFAGRFRKRLDLGEVSPLDDINIPMASVCFVQKSDGFSLPLFMDKLYWELHGAGALVKEYRDVIDLSLIIYVSFKSSRFFSEKLFFEPKLDVIVVKDAGDCVAIYDSGGGRYYNQSAYGLGASLDIGKLTSLAAFTPYRSIKETHARAVGSADQRPEMVAQKGADLGSAQATQRNSKYALSMLRFDNYGLDGKKSKSFYVGARSGRVADQKESNFTLQDLSQWVDTVVDQMHKGGSVGRLIKSYAQPSADRPACDPISIILDFSDLDGPLEVRNGVVSPEFYYIDGGPIFTLLIDGESIDLELEYDAERVEFSVGLVGGSLGIAEFYPIIEYINSHRKIKVLFEDGTTYLLGSFYRLSLPYEQGISVEDSWAGSVLFGVPCLQDANIKEKGVSDGHGNYINTVAGEFGPESIFYKLDLLRNSGAPGVVFSDLGEFARYIPGCDLVICADMSTEPCDFILSSPDKLCFVHVKCGDTANPGAPAGAIAEVGSQAIKNIHYLVSNNDQQVPGNFGMWNSSWPSSTSGYPLSTRYRLFNGVISHAPAADGSTSQEVWDLICSRRKSLQCKKEIWIVVGRSFSKNSFINSMTLGVTAPPEVVQAYQLIEDWVGTANDYDVTLKIFTST